ncbi:hypothetical protein MHBO_003447 [Bonamia ostreae]|uniref:Uncharacterized protein n=1 Tax=Bonamia ostreae TaxID=126728 RepID=A0ABV2AQJ2_9EUKA
MGHKRSTLAGKWRSGMLRREKGVAGKERTISLYANDQLEYIPKGSEMFLPMCRS